MLCCSKLWVHVSRLPVLHPDRDQWKHTEANTKYLMISSFHCHSHRALSTFHYKSSNTSSLTCWMVLESNCLGLLTIFHSNKFRQWKRGKEPVWISKLYGCMFPGSLCCTQTEIIGNALCSLIILLYFSMPLTKNHTGMYKKMQKEIMILICSKH